MFDRKKKTPTELLQISQLGSDAATTRRAMSPLLQEEREYILNSLAHGSQDKTTYDRLSGRAEFVLQLERLLELREAEGATAVAVLQQQQRKEN